MMSSGRAWLLADQVIVSSLTGGCAPDSWINCETTIRSAAANASAA